MEEVYYLEWDEENEEHLARHGLTPSRIAEVLANRHITVANPEHEGRILLIGRTHGGDVLTISIAPTRDAGTWRPVTGWRASDEELRLFERHVGRKP